MPKVDVAGLLVDAITKQEFLVLLDQRIQNKQKTFVTTPYAEFLYAALRNPEIKELFNKSDIAIPDGISVLWAQKFLSMPFSVSGFYARIIQAWWQVIYTGAGILLRPQSVYRIFPEKITGADVVWDICALAEQQKYSVYLLGGMGEVPQIAADKIKQRLPNLNIVGVSNKQSTDPSIITDITAGRPDIVFVAFGPIKQELWIERHLAALPTYLMMGVGGTFDYIAGRHKAPPAFVRAMGIEWLYRLITQPHRWRRIKNAVPDLILALVRFKVFMSLPLRRNVVAVIFNNDNKILVGKRRERQSQKFYVNQSATKFDNYWQLPQGGLDPGEDIVEGARREAREEVGVTQLELVGVSEHQETYIWNNACRKLISNYYKNCGKQQWVVYLRFTGTDEQIHIDQDEFSDYQWVSLRDLKEIVHSERHAIAEIILRDVLEGKVLENSSL
jgi:N-acetylglucosaminyldiphosphoundecaprenol N-acetyl-beta-D-mannosaminyltransferase